MGVETTSSVYWVVRFLSLCWITVHLHIKGVLIPSEIKPTQFRNSKSQVAELQVHASTPGKPVTNSRQVANIKQV